MKRRKRGRKLLVATAGLATVVYVACKEQPPGNLPAPPPTEIPVGNLPAPPPVIDAGADEDAGDAATATIATSASASATPPKPPPPIEMPPGNLPAPPPMKPPPPPKKNK